MAGVKIGNEYIAVMGKFYEDTPKAVFAALAYSYASIFGSTGEGGDETVITAEVIERLKYEWRVLQENGIIQQQAPKPTKGGAQ